MKRSLIVILGLMFVLGITASAFAIHSEIPSETQAIVAKGATQITLGGELRFRGETRNNTTDFNGGQGDHINSYDGRVRLNVQADVSKNTTGYVQIETGDEDADTADTYTWGAGGSDGKGMYGEGNGKRGDLTLLQAWIQSKNVVGPIGIKVGHMPVKLGNGLFLDHSRLGDDAIMLFASPSKDLEIAVVNAKATEGNTGSTGGSTTVDSTGNPQTYTTVGYTSGSDDTDVYAGLITYKGTGFSLGADVTYLVDQNAAANGLTLWNYGVRMDSKAGPLGFKFDVEYQRGLAKNITNSPAGIAAGDTEYNGYAMLAGVNYTMDNLTLDAEIARGSGDGDSNNDEVNTFQTAQGNSQHYTYVYEYRTRSAGVNGPVAGKSGMGAMNTGIANTTYYKVGAALKASKDLSLNLNLYRLSATKPVSTTNSNSYSNDEIGDEVDVKMTYQLDKNLVYFVEGGYLMAGDIWRNQMDAPVCGTCQTDPNDAYALRHGVTLSF
ncbi:MAG: alginate export family protein [Nitrospirae bacterium]|nr:alginate export family protein [Nitrospirota bacterium]